MIKEGCQCFTCRHGDEPRLCKAYCDGFIEGCEQFLAWAKDNNIPMGSLCDTDISGLYAQIKCNDDEFIAIMLKDNTWCHLPTWAIKDECGDNMDFWNFEGLGDENTN